MKQTSFVVEIAISENGQPTIIIREPSRGQIVKITTNPSDVESFLLDVIEKVKSINPSNS